MMNKPNRVAASAAPAVPPQPARLDQFHLEPGPGLVVLDRKSQTRKQPRHEPAQNLPRPTGKPLPQLSGQETAIKRGKGE